MNADQLIEGIGKAVSAANAGEFCLLGFDHWLTCMNKTEWAAWIQAGAVTIALLSPLFVKRKEKYESLKIALEFLPQLSRKTGLILWHINFFEKKENFETSDDIVAKIETLNDLDFSAEFVSAITRYDHHLMSKILTITNETKNIVDSTKKIALTDFAISELDFARKFAYLSLKNNYEKLYSIERWLASIEFIMNPRNIFSQIGIKYRIIYALKRFWIFLKM